MALPMMVLQEGSGKCWTHSAAPINVEKVYTV